MNRLEEIEEYERLVEIIYRGDISRYQFKSVQRRFIQDRVLYYIKLGVSLEDLQKKADEVESLRRIRDAEAAKARAESLKELDEYNEKRRQEEIAKQSKYSNFNFFKWFTDK